MKIKRIIEIEESIYQGIINGKKADKSVEPREIVRSFQATIADAIAQSTPYNPSGGLTEAEKIICKIYLEDLDKTHTCNEYKLLMSLIDNAPPVDLWQMRQEATENALKKAEVLYARPQGEWINHRNDYGHNIADCSLCGKTMQWHDEDGDGIPRYCWYCGADMRKGGDPDEENT